MQILITGSAGFIGFNLAKFLLKNKKIKVIGVDNINNYYSQSLKKNRIKVLKRFKNFSFYRIDLKNQKKLLPCAAYLNGEYNIKGLYVGVPVVIGKNGVEKVLEIDLNEKEKNNFRISVQAVEELFESARKIDPDLSS